MTDKCIYTQIEKLISRFKSGDSQSFDDLYYLTRSKVYNLAFTIVKDRLLAEDIVQDVFIVVFNSINTLQNPRLFLAWLNKITYNISIKEINKKNKFILADSENIFPFIPDENIDNLPLDYYLQNENSKEMLNLLSKLPFIHSSVLIMRYYKDMKLSEIAYTLNISEGTVKSRISNAKKGFINIYIEYTRNNSMLGFSLYNLLKDSSNNNTSSSKPSKNVLKNTIGKFTPSTAINLTLHLSQTNTSPVHGICDDLNINISYIRFKNIYNQYINVDYKINSQCINIKINDAFYDISYIEIYDSYNNMIPYIINHSNNLNSKI